VRKYKTQIPADQTTIAADKVGFFPSFIRGNRSSNLRLSALNFPT
jgi:hypothetical protein